MVVDRTRLAPACPRGVFAFPLAGKCRSMWVRLVMLAAVSTAARFERALSLASYVVALSTTSRDGLSWREPQSRPIRVLHRGAIE